MTGASEGFAQVRPQLQRFAVYQVVSRKRVIGAPRAARVVGPVAVASGDRCVRP